MFPQLQNTNNSKQIEGELKQKINELEDQYKRKVNEIQRKTDVSWKCNKYVL